MSRARVLTALSVLILLPSGVLGAAPTLREATLKVTFINSSTCEVDAGFRVAHGATATLEHRLQLFEGTSVEVLEISGATPLRPAYTSARTQVLDLQTPSPDADSYRVRYRVVQLEERAYRCPLWLPTAPSDGRSLGVQVAVRLPAGATPSGGGFPAFRWAESEGVARLGHIPAFVRVPFNQAGHAAIHSWNINRLMDGTAILLLVVGMAGFIWRKRR